VEIEEDYGDGGGRRRWNKGKNEDGDGRRK